MLSARQSTPKVGIVVLNYNGWRDTIECLESLQKLRYLNFEVIVVDNASPNDSWEKLSSWVRDYREDPLPKGFNIFLIQTKTNLGYGGGNNAGIRHALENACDYVWLLNNDTIVDEHALAALIDCAIKIPQIGLVGSQLYYHEDRSLQALGGGSINPILGVTKYRLDPASALDYIHGASLLAKAELIRQIGFLDETFFLYWEDTDWSLRAKKAGWRLACAQDSKIWHKDGRSVGKGSAFADYQHTRSGCIFFKKHYGPRSFIPIGIMILGKVLKRCLRGQISRVPLILKALIRGLRVSSNHSAAVV